MNDTSGNLSFAQIKRHALEGQRQALLEEYQAVNAQLSRTLSDADCVRLRRQHCDLERQLFDLERQIEHIESLPMGGRIPPPGGASQSNSFRLPLRSPPPPCSFAGRIQELDRIGKVLLTNTEAEVTVALTGIGGVGKTALAKKLGRRNEAHFPGGVLWLDIGRLAERDVICRQLSLHLGYDIDQVPPSSEHLREALRRRGRLLAILDDVWKVDDGRWVIETLLPLDRAVLVTTRHEDIAHHLSHRVLKIKGLSVTDSLGLLSSFLGDIKSYETDAEEIATRLDGLPLALEIAARLCELGKEDLSELLLRLREGKRLIGLPGDESPSVKASLDLSYNQLDSESRRRFRALGTFAPAPAPFDLQALARLWRDKDRDVAEQYARVLVRLGLLEHEGSWHPSRSKGIPIYTQHGLLQDLARDYAEKYGEWAGLVKDHGYHYYGVVQLGAKNGGWRWLPQIVHAYRQYFFDLANSPNEREVALVVDFTEQLQRFLWSGD